MIAREQGRPKVAPAACRHIFTKMPHKELWRGATKQARNAGPAPSDGAARARWDHMLDLLRDFLADFGDGAKTQDQFDESDYRLAAAALLVHVIMIDGNETKSEHERLAGLLKDRFGLDDKQTADLIEAATAADREAVDLFRFTNLINRSLDEDGRRRIVEMMWQVVYADGKVNEFEDNVVWRAADLLGISARDRVTLKQQVAEQGAAAKAES